VQLGRKSARLPRAPDHLQDATKVWWKSVVRGWELEPHHLHVLQIACESWDRASEAAAAVKRDGAYFTDRLGSLRPHPAIVVELQSRKMFIAAVRELGLDTKPPDAPRAPALPHYRKS
jgi:P27 family predicted phage terminase small subunit